MQPPAILSKCGLIIALYIKGNIGEYLGSKVACKFCLEVVRSRPELNARAGLFENPTTENET